MERFLGVACLVPRTRIRVKLQLKRLFKSRRNKNVFVLCEEYLSGLRKSELFLKIYFFFFNFS